MERIDRNTLYWMGVTLIVFPVLVLLGLLMRAVQAETAAGMLRDTGYGEDTIGRVQALLRKEKLKLDPEVQTLEDVVDLVFLENYLEDFVAKHPEYDEAKWIDILKKTWFKMSRRGRSAALSMIRLPEKLLPVIRQAAELGEKMDRAKT